MNTIVPAPAYLHVARSLYTLARKGGIKIKTDIKPIVPTPNCNNKTKVLNVIKQK